MPAREQVLLAYFAGRGDAAGALARLIGEGISHDAIRMLPKRVRHLDDLGVRPASRLPEGAALGALLGCGLGAVAGAFAAAGSLVFPELGVVLAGPLVSALAGAGAAGFLGVTVGALVGARMPAYEAAYLGNAVLLGGALLAVRCPAERLAGVEEILTASGARGVSRQRCD